MRLRPNARGECAAEALGGKNRILALKTLTIYGYGQQAYQNGGGNITASPDAAQKWVNVNGLQRTIDLEHGRMRLQQRLVQDFVFGKRCRAGDRVRDLPEIANCSGVTILLSQSSRRPWLNQPIEVCCWVVIFVEYVWCHRDSARIHPDLSSSALGVEVGARRFQGSFPNFTG